MSSRPQFPVALIAVSLIGLPEGQTNDPFPQPIAREMGVVLNKADGTIRVIER